MAEVDPHAACKIKSRDAWHAGYKWALLNIADDQVLDDLHRFRQEAEESGHKPPTFRCQKCDSPFWVNDPNDPAMARCRGCGTALTSVD